jgi:hypothetical protein
VTYSLPRYTLLVYAVPYRISWTSERAKKRIAEDVAEEEVGDGSNGEASGVVTRAAKKAKATKSSRRCKK